MLIKTLDQSTLCGWIKLRTQLWPNHGGDAHALEGENIILCPDKLASFVAIADSGDRVGFADASLRHDYVNGCDTTPVVFLEGIWVIEAYRRQGIAAQLVTAVQVWGQSKGCRELASDTAVDNLAAQKMHHCLGFQETERVIFFKKTIADCW
ncbi:aminoglycoside 6'-N-acetyltransferase [Yersinia enterocolitica]|uniref:aminoglycoside 6'-N-acetyltransferase n=1 Tax=Yersinia enterocolitica TaxID=630 RepID=UPI001C8D91BD|nr:aminoglycoside 6'-N-acetyltransferase [Yersinia enterocolitica]MBX9476190.1 GNAT family N-acetyltransferase [Yersinia enterocolitica]MBX9486684.1 GNAT family N-acetyltransferase [Yersinia enterocolitica]MBX9492683.1 GNAT family N-acetyltransferase [Yersinia enterocolitica]HDL8052827.1 GNAT family N-acetyltransferase [Yersinia enterocolitica]HDL8056261.1 GNAT family N-acetyltransferase [Yersinia enterocolitica]